MELHLDDLDANQLMEKARSDEAESDGGWRQEAFVQHLASLDQVRHIFWSYSFASFIETPAIENL